MEQFLEMPDKIRSRPFPYISQKDRTAEAQ